MMNRQQKEAAISTIKDLFSNNQAAFLVNYQGLTVSNLHSLRKDLRKIGGTFKVTKARLMQIATKDLQGCQDFSNQFKNQVGIVFVKQEVPAVAKTIVNFSKQNEHLNVISGFFESRTISKQEIENLASIPSKEVLLAQLMGTLQAPISALVRTLNAIATNVQSTLQQVAEKGEN
jgi:large subunit ribosomal protein L10